MDALTGLRALAAWSVVGFHIRGLFFKLFPGSEVLFKWFFNVGNIGVDLFFILSGFIISYQYAEHFRVFDSRKYVWFLWKRLARIYPVHLLTMFLTFCMVAFVSLSGMSDPWPSNFWQYHKYSYNGLIKSLLLVHGWDIPVKLIWNFVSWSLSLEWLAYLLFPLSVFLTLKISSAHMRILVSFGLLLSIGISTFIIVFPGPTAYGVFRIVGCFLAGGWRFGYMSQNSDEIFGGI